MTLPDAILQLEGRSVGPSGEPTLGRALELAAREWRAGNRDRELRLHLLFLAWYCNFEPPHLTGYQGQHFPSVELPQLFQDVYRSFEDELQDDPECLFVIGLIAGLTPYLLGEDEPTWQRRSEEFRKRYRFLRPNGLDPSHFDGRGAYGNYFAHQVAVPGGF